MSEKKLASAFQFDEADLNANRQGELSAEQVHILRKRRSAQFGLLLLAYVVLNASIFVPLMVASKAPIGGVFLLLEIVFSLIMALSAAWTNARFQQDIRQREVKRLFGRIGLSITDKNYARLRIEGQRFRIKNKQALALHDGEYYNIYIAPHSKTILSAEPVDMRAEAEAAYAQSIVHLAEPGESDDAEEKPKRGTLILGDDGEIVRGARVKRQSGSE